MNSRTNFLSVGLLICALLAMGVCAKAQAQQTESRKWEYCAITNSYGTQKNNRIYGLAVITFFEEAGYRQESIQIDRDLTGIEPNERYQLVQREAFAKAFVQLGNDRWELVGSLPYVNWIASKTNDKTAIYFKRPKQ